MAPNKTTNGHSSSFEKIREIDTEYGIKITKFKSVKTGLTIVHADIDGKYNAILSKLIMLHFGFLEEAKTCTMCRAHK